MLQSNFTIEMILVIPNSDFSWSGAIKTKDWGWWKRVHFYVYFTIENKELGNEDWFFFVLFKVLRTNYTLN